jgi:DNA-binding winged helix-turn-helix (wHTH) protein
MYRKKKTDVVLVSWPSQYELRRYCIATCIPRVLVVEPHSTAPESDDILEDWLRPPISKQDLTTRIENLQRRYARVYTPEIDECGELRYGDRSVTVSETQAELARPLVCNFREVVPRAQLMEILAQKKSGVNRNALDLHIMRLRRRVTEANLSVTTVWGRGYRLGPLEESSDLRAGDRRPRPAARRTASQAD